MRMSTRRFTAAGLTAVALAATATLAAAPVKKLQFTDTRLKNGLRVIISEDHAAPVFSIVVNYNVGSRDERRGRTGFAHLFEHMMFKGSENVGPGEHPYLMFMYGGSMTTPKYRGDWTASTSVRTAVTVAALNDLLGEIAEMRDTAVPASEFEDSKRALVASFALTLENTGAVLNYYVQSWTYGFAADYWDQYAARISAVTPAQAQAAAKKYWDASRLHIVAVGDAPQIADVLRKHGTLELYDADGKPMKTGPSQ